MHKWVKFYSRPKVRGGEMGRKDRKEVIESIKNKGFKTDSKIIQF